LEQRQPMDTGRSIPRPGHGRSSRRRSARPPGITRPSRPRERAHRGLQRARPAVVRLVPVVELQTTECGRSTSPTPPDEPLRAGCPLSRTGFAMATTSAGETVILGGQHRRTPTRSSDGLHVREPHLGLQPLDGKWAPRGYRRPGQSQLLLDGLCEARARSTPWRQVPPLRRVHRRVAAHQRRWASTVSAFPTAAPTPRALGYGRGAYFGHLTLSATTAQTPGSACSSGPRTRRPTSPPPVSRPDGRGELPRARTSRLSAALDGSAGYSTGGAAHLQRPCDPGAAQLTVGYTAPRAEVVSPRAARAGPAPARSCGRPTTLTTTRSVRRAPRQLDVAAPGRLGPPGRREVREFDLVSVATRLQVLVEAATTTPTSPREQRDLGEFTVLNHAPTVELLCPATGPGRDVLVDLA